MATPNGYQCVFKVEIPDIFLCKKCSLVARRLTVTSCCGENFCHDCISKPKEQNKPCPECGEEGFTLFNHVKLQRQISNLQAYCSLKERGCGWSGPLKQLEAHLDPDQGNCQYVDTKCPLNCPMAIPKNKVEQHVSEECVRRDFTCQHCNFKATYEEVVGTHLAECSYVPLQCPNRCGVTCEREVIEDHMRICRLEEVECEFSDVGCKERPKREDQEEHSRQSTQKHMVLTATATIKTRETMEKTLAEKDKMTNKKLEDQNQRLQVTTVKLEEMKQKCQKLERLTQKKLLEQEQLTQKKLQEQEQIIQEKLREQEQRFLAGIQSLQEKYEKQQQDMLQIQQSLLAQLEEKDKKLQRLDDSLSQLVSSQQHTEKSLKVMKGFSLKTLLSSVFFKIDNFEEMVCKQSRMRGPLMKIPTEGYEIYVYLDCSRCFLNGEQGVFVKFEPTNAKCNEKLQRGECRISYEVLNDSGDKVFVGKWTGSLRYSISRVIPGYCSLDDSIPVSKILPSKGTLYFNIVSIKHL